MEDQVAEIRMQMEMLKTENKLAQAEMQAKFEKSLEALAEDVAEGFKQQSAVCIIS